MKKVIAVAICGVALTGCSSWTSWMPSFDMSMPSFGGGGGGPTAATLAVESDPPGANASAGGTSCRTPCRLTVPVNGPFSVNVALEGFIPQSIPVRVVQPDDPRLGSESGESGGVRLEPNPVYVELERAPPPPQQQKKPPKKKPPVTAVRHAPSTTAKQAPATNQGAPTTAVAPNNNQAPPLQQQQQAPATNNNSSAPWPMPR